MRSSRESSLLGLLEDVLGHLGLGDLRPVLLDDGALVLAELLADRVELAAEDVLALLLLHAGLDVLLDATPDLHEREPLPLELERELEPLADVDGLEQLDLLLEGEVGRVARRVGERAGLADRAHEGRDAAVVASQLEDLLDHGAVLALELADAAVGRLLVGSLLDLDEQAALRVGRRGARDPAVQAVQRDGATAAGKPDAIGDLGDGADLRVAVVVLGHEQHAVLVADVDGEGDVHVREDDEVFQRDEQQTDRVLAHGSLFRTNAVGGSETVPARAQLAVAGLATDCYEARHVPVRKRSFGARYRMLQTFSAFRVAEALEREPRDATCEDVRGSADATPAPRHHARDEHAAAPEDETGVVSRVAHPARLVQDDDARVAGSHVVELRHVVRHAREARAGSARRLS